jgi:hypothetical protein
MRLLHANARNDFFSHHITTAKLTIGVGAMGFHSKSMSMSMSRDNCSREERGLIAWLKNCIDHEAARLECFFHIDIDI